MCKEECLGDCQKDIEIMCKKCYDNFLEKEIMKAEYKAEEIRENCSSK